MFPYSFPRCLAISAVTVLLTQSLACQNNTRPTQILEKSSADVVSLDKLSRLFESKEKAELYAGAVKRTILHRPSLSEEPITRQFIAQYDKVSVEYNATLDLISFGIERPTSSFEMMLGDRVSKVEQDTKHLESIYQDTKGERSAIGPLLDAAIEAAKKLAILIHDLLDSGRQAELGRIRSELASKRMKAFDDI